MNRAAFLDRDGVINYKAPEGQYVTCLEEFQFIPGVEEAIGSLNKAGYIVIVVTNQRCVAKGLLTAQGLDSIHEWMCQELADAGATIAGVYSCPHENEPPCGCRKPAPGMLLRAARVHEIDLTTSWLVGDSDIDIQAGRRASCRTARILERDEVAGGSADVFARSLLDATHQILKFGS
jgi:D-glycero-D-manno-heptose 1,7-bisphosphate phosphatase